MKWLSNLFMKRSNWSLPYFIFLLIFVVLPLVLIFLYAFQDAEGNFTLKNFSKFISSPEAANTFVYSIGVAIITTVSLKGDGSALYSAYVDKHSGAYAGYGGIVRLYEVAAG